MSKLKINLAWAAASTLVYNHLCAKGSYTLHTMRPALAR